MPPRPGARVGVPGVRRRAADRQPRPRDLAGQAQLVEPLRAVARHARRQDRGFPGPRGDLEALELLDRREQPSPPLELGARGDVLPPEQEPDEVLGGDRLDLAPEPLGRVPVDPREEPPLAELHGRPAGRLGVGGVEAAPQDDAGRLQAGERADRRAPRGARCAPRGWPPCRAPGEPGGRAPGGRRPLPRRPSRRTPAGSAHVGLDAARPERGPPRAGAARRRARGPRLRSRRAPPDRRRVSSSNHAAIRRLGRARRPGPAGGRAAPRRRGNRGAPPRGRARSPRGRAGPGPAPSRAARGGAPPPGCGAPRAGRRRGTCRGGRSGSRGRAATARSSRGTAARTAPDRKPSRRRTSPSTSVASWRQSWSVWRTIGWSGISTGPAAAFSWQAASAGNTAAIRSSASMRWMGGGVRRPPRWRRTISARPRFHRHRTWNMGDRSSACVEDVRRVPGREELRHVLEREALAGAEGEHDRVVAGRRLQLEVEPAAEPLP